MTRTSVKAEYIWIGGDGEFRSKTKMIYNDTNTKPYSEFSERFLDPWPYPIWNYDGSSTNQADGGDSEVLLRPVKVWIDPFSAGSAINDSGLRGPGSKGSTFVLCETIYPDGTYPKTSTRHKAVEIFNKNIESKPLFGLEQEFYIFSKHGIENGGRGGKGEKYENHQPLGSYDGIPEPQGRYYCGVGGTNVFGRAIVTDALDNCIRMGLNVSGMNAEVAPGQWEIQVGPSEGIDAGDELLMLRYILHRVSEKYNVEIVLDPKPLQGDWNGSGCHTNYSTLEMREGRTVSADDQAIALRKGITRKSATGFECISEAIDKLRACHPEHMLVYGRDNELRMTGLHETANYDEFTSGVGDRTASVRIPHTTEKDQKGYLEDRRPGANMDPYVVTSKIFETTVGKD